MLDLVSVLSLQGRARRNARVAARALRQHRAAATAREALEVGATEPPAAPSSTIPAQPTGG